MSDSNNHIVLIVGKPSSGKSSSLRNLDNQDRALYLNTDLKDLPYKHDFVKVDVDSATDILDYLKEFEEHPDMDKCVLDTLTYLMALYENKVIMHSADTRKAWQEYAQIYRDTMHLIKTGSKSYAILAHTDDILDETNMVMESKVPIKGSVGKIGIEGDFTTILTAKRISIKEAKKWTKDNDLLTISDEEEEDGIKYVFQTRIDKSTIGEKTRSHIGLWNRSEKYIDNDLNLVFNRLNEYYK